MAEKFTHAERVALVRLCYQQSRRAACRKFKEMFPNRPTPNPSTALRLCKRFEETGTVADRPRSGRPKTATNDDTVVKVLGSIIASPHISLRKLAQETQISRGSIARILKNHKNQPNKVQLVQKLEGEDTSRRIHFCQWVLAQGIEIIDDIFFSDEATFHLNGTVNKHNFRYWTDTNEKEFIQKDCRVTVWCAIWRDAVIGPYFFDSPVNGESYLHMLETYFAEFLDDMLLVKRKNFWFQHDDATPHCSQIVREWLHDKFPMKWIGRRGPVEWPPKSPDLTPVDFFLWSHLKSAVYEKQPQTMDELKESIRTECSNVTKEQLSSVMESCKHRIIKCHQGLGFQFEIALK